MKVALWNEGTGYGTIELWRLCKVRMKEAGDSEEKE